MRVEELRFTNYEPILGKSFCSRVYFTPKVALVFVTVM